MDICKNCYKKITFNLELERARVLEKARVSERDRERERERERERKRDRLQNIRV